MIITICNRQFNTNEIEDIRIHEGRIFVTTTEDYFEFRYIKEEDIKEAKDYLKFQEITRHELLDAVNTIMITCDYFINEKEQCEPCPLKKREGCIFGRIPIDWRT